MLLLQSDDAYRVDTLVHAESVLPVVGRVGVLAVILDAYSLILAHVAQHDVLSYGAHLVAWGILSVAHQLYAERREVALGRAGVSHRHGEVAFLVSLVAHTCPHGRVVWDIVLGVFGRAASLRVAVDAEDREVTCLAWPHPVVCLAAEFAHALGDGEYEAHVCEVTIGGQIILVALVERLQLDTQSRVLGLHALLLDILERVEQGCLFRVAESPYAVAEHLVGIVALLYHERHEEILVRKLLLV